MIGPGSDKKRILNGHFSRPAETDPYAFMIFSGTRHTRPRWKRSQQQDFPDWLRLWPTTTPFSTNISLTGLFQRFLLYLPYKRACICYSPLDHYFSEKFSSIQRKRALKYHFLDDLPRKEKVYCENCTTDWTDLTNRIKEMFRQCFSRKI